MKLKCCSISSETFNIAPYGSITIPRSGRLLKIPTLTLYLPGYFYNLLVPGEVNLPPTI